MPDSRHPSLTGLYPDQTLIRRNAIYLREHLPNVSTLAQMSAAIPVTATRISRAIFHYNVPKHIGTSGHDDPDSWNNTINPEGRDVDDEDKIFSLIPGSFGGTLSWLAADGTDEEQTDGIAAAAAVTTSAEVRGKKTPFFPGRWPAAHTLRTWRPKKYFDMYPTGQLQVPQVPEGYPETLPDPARKSITRKIQNKLPDDVARQAIQAYYASITFADAQAGKILNALRDTGLADNTIVLFTSDHGYHMGEHGHYQKTTLFENAAHVPLIMAGPGITAAGKSTRSLAEMVDFYPTLAELSDLKAPDFLAGVSLVPTLKNPAEQPRSSAFTQYDVGYSLRTDRYRYTEWGPEAKQGRELYDHENDPQEMQNLADDPGRQDVIRQLSNELRERIAAGQKPPAGLKQITFENNRKVPVTP
ncbi:MAG: sulfatase-like hydrolase/transferase [Planctomycetaceae bacterium]